MFFRFPSDALWNPERSVVEFGIAWANMRAWCGFPGACSNSCFQMPPPRNAASKPIIFTGPRLELIAELKLRQAVDRRRECRDHRSRSKGPGNPGALSTPYRLSPGRSMRAAQQASSGR